MGYSPLILKCEAQVYALAGYTAALTDATQLILEAGHPKILAIHLPKQSVE
jgi:hypothetical protein